VASLFLNGTFRFCGCDGALGVLFVLAFISGEFFEIPPIGSAIELLKPQPHSSNAMAGILKRKNTLLDLSTQSIEGGISPGIGLARCARRFSMWPLRGAVETTLLQIEG
jgi:hypothetical protein